MPENPYQNLLYVLIDELNFFSISLGLIWGVFPYFKSSRGDNCRLPASRRPEGMHLCYKQLQVCYINFNYFADFSSEETKEHKLQTLSDVAAAVKTEFADLTKKLEAELEKYAVKEKEGWVELDNLEEECKNLKHQVEQSANNLVSWD